MDKADRYAWWVVLVLTLVYSISYVDRQMLSLLIGPIRRDLGVSDTQIGLLTGFAFAGVYAVLGILLGRIADTKNRVGLISISLAVWSLATAACGLAQSFWQLFAARVGVGAGEASLTPAAYSIFADYFPPARLGRAVAVYTLAQYVGMAAALVLGALLIGRLSAMPPLHWGVLGTIRPWQLAMVVVSLPGLLAIALLRTVREPARLHSVQETSLSEAVSKGAVLDQLWRGRGVYLPHFLGFSLSGLYGGGFAVWLPEFLRRAHGMPIEQAGMVLALVLILAGGPSTLLGGWIADGLRARGRFGAPMWIAAACMLSLWPVTVAMPLVHGVGPAIALICLATVLITLPTAVAPAALQLVTPNRMRAQVSAVYLLCTNLIGAGLGPVAVGLLTDLVFKRPEGLALSLSLLGGVICPLAALILWSGRAAFARAAATAD